MEKCKKMTDEWPFGDLQRGHFSAIVADPPWKYVSFTELTPENWDGRRDAEKHYKVMRLRDIMALPVADLATPDTHLFLWTTGPFLEKSFSVLRAWGFRYSSVAFTWTKLKRSHNDRQLRILPTAEADLFFGPGHTTRKNSEFCLLGRKGNPKRLSKSVREPILAPVREHSRKPDEVYERVQAYCAGPYLDLFSRQRRPGWTSWGNEVDLFPGA